jgi:peptide/nickel transport system permease protein
VKHYVARQLVQLVVVVVGISILSFAILHVIGDPVLLLLPQNAGKAEFERYRHLLGLDQPIWFQYWKFVSRAVQGDFGKSWYADTPAFRLVLERMPPTVYLTLAGLGVALAIACRSDSWPGSAGTRSWTTSVPASRWRGRRCPSSGSASC